MIAPATGIETACPVPIAAYLVNGGPHRQVRLRLHVTPGGFTVVSWEAEDWHTREPLTNRLDRRSYERIEGMAQSAARLWLLASTGRRIGDLGPSRPAEVA